jgi:hypothetical protein
MCIATLFIITKMCKQPKYPSSYDTFFFLILGFELRATP